MKSNGKGKPDMSTKRTYHGNARFIELGSLGAPFRSLINVDHITNVRFEQKIGNEEAQYDDAGEMTAPPQQFLEGWTIVLVLGHGAGGQNIMFPTEEAAVGCYNTILDMIVGTGAPMSRMQKLKVTPEESLIEGLDGAPIANDDSLPGDDDDVVTDDDVDALANPDVDVDAIADAVEAGVGKTE